MTFKASQTWDSRWLSSLATFGNEQIILLCIVIQLVKVLVTSLICLTHLSGLLFPLCFGVRPETCKGEKEQESSKIYNWIDSKKET